MTVSLKSTISTSANSDDVIFFLIMYAMEINQFKQKGAEPNDSKM